MSRKKFIITIDTEGDDLWRNKITSHGLKEITVKNAENLQRFQSLCERFHFIPTYLVNYEMAKADAFIELAREALKQNKCEIGMHMHAWNSPPIEHLPYNPRGTHTYIGEYPPRLRWEKMKYLAGLLQDTFQKPVTSFRSGRWYLDEFTLKCLKRLGFFVDCTVTPGISWADQIGNRMYGTDYSKDRKNSSYMLSGKNIHKEGKSGIYEVPPTILSRYRIGGFQLKKDRIWLRPDGSNLKDMVWIVNKVKKSREIDYLEFMLHSSELTAGMNPTFRSKYSIELLYEQLESLFWVIQKDFDGTGISEYVKEKYLL